MTRTSSLLALCVLALAVACDKPAKAPALATLPQTPQTQDPARAVVVVTSDGMDVDWHAPWGTGKPWTRTSTGLVVDGQRILVVGWSLRNAQHVAVQEQGASARTAARVILLDEDTGLAVLGVDDPTFWKRTEPAKLSERLPPLGDVKILHAAYDAPRVDTSPGSVAGFLASGGFNFPQMRIVQADVQHIGVSDLVSAGGQIVGAVTSNANGEVMAMGAPTLSDFLAQAAHQPYAGYAQLGIYWQRLSNPALHDELGLHDDEGGVRVQEVLPKGSAAGVLEAGDVVLTVAGVKIDRDGTFQHPQAGRIGYGVLFSEGRHPGDVVEVGVLRGGVRKTVTVTLKRFSFRDNLIPTYTSLGDRSYVVRGGLLFETLSREYLQTFGKDWETHAPPQLLEPWELARWSPTPDRPRIIVLTRVLPVPATLGYEHLRNLIVERVNDVPVRSLDDVNEAFSHPHGAFHVVTFAAGQGVRRIALDVQEALSADARTREQYHLPEEHAQTTTEHPAAR
jgi:hypothetical protein